MKKTYPIYRKDYAHVYKIVSEDLIIQIFANGFNGACNINYMDNNLIVDNAVKLEPSNEAEFLEKYYSVRRKLDDICLIQIDK